MIKANMNEACPKCHQMGSHSDDCPNFPKEWKECKHIVNYPYGDGCCLKCGMPIF